MGQLKEDRALAESAVSGEIPAKNSRGAVTKQMLGSHSGQTVHHIHI